MAAPIQTIPQGLLGLLQLKELGRNPRELIETVQPTVEQFAFWIERNAVDLLNGTNASVALPTANAGAVQFTANVPTVPNNATWYVTHYTIFAALLAAETLRFAPAMILPTLASIHILNTDVADVITARGREVVAGARGFWMPPGAKLAVYVFDDLTAATINVQGQVRGVQVPI